MSLRRAASRVAVALVLAAPLLAAGSGGPGDRLREAQQALHDAARDTIDHAADPARLDALGEALVVLARLADAEAPFRRALAARPDDARALAGLGHVALLRGRDAEAESLLTRAGDGEGVTRDLYDLHLRRHAWASAAGLAEAAGEPGRREMLERLATLPADAPPAGVTHATVAFQRLWPAPLVRIQLEGLAVLMAIDPGAPDLLLDPAALRRAHVDVVPGEREVSWLGTRTAARNALVRRLDLGGMTLASVPAAVLPLHAYSLDVNPEGEPIAGVIGLPVLERFDVTLDFARQQLELRRRGGSVPAGTRVAFERWGENELTVYGTLNGGRRMAFWLATGLPGAAVGLPQETADELGLKAGAFSNFVRSVGTPIHGRPWSQVTLGTIAVGALVRDHAPGWAGAMDEAEIDRHGARRDALLGPAFFANRRVTFDWAGRALVFEDR